MTRRSTRLAVAALVAVLPLLAVACGDDEDSASSSTTTTEQLAACSEVYTAGEGAEEGPDAIEARGEPELQACDPQDGDLLIVDEIVGSGAEVPAGATVTVHYSGVGASSGTVFDSSWTSGQPISFPLDQVIPGWTEGMVGMKEGGRRTLVIPPDLAYGDSGPAPGDYLVFTVDLVSVDAGAAEATTTLAPTTTVAG
jgi:FKBP-type peptidyl-prolyl cis-trans isomerase